jgi:hypothetical protein
LLFNQSPSTTNCWGASTSASGNILSISNVGYNGNLSPGQSVSVGCQGTHNGNFQLPTCSTN